MSNTCRAFCGVLYEDSESYNFEDVVCSLGDFFDEFAYISHDFDTDSDGVIKKSHVHWVGRKKNATTLSKVVKVSGLPDNQIEFVKSFKAVVRYLVHFDQPKKTQYSVDSIVSNFDIRNFFDKNEGQIVLGFIDKRLSGMSYYQILQQSISDGTYSEFRRNHAIIQLVVHDVMEREGAKERALCI